MIEIDDLPVHGLMEVTVRFHQGVRMKTTEDFINKLLMEYDNQEKYGMTTTHPVTSSKTVRKDKVPINVTVKFGYTLHGDKRKSRVQLKWLLHKVMAGMTKMKSVAKVHLTLRQDLLMPAKMRKRGGY